MMFELEDNDHLVQSWCRVFILGVPQLNLNFLVEEAVPALLPFTSLTKKKLTRRLLSGEMLMEIGSVYGQKAFEKDKKLVSISLSFGDDLIDWKMRKLGANRLRRIIPKVTKYIEENPKYYEIIIEKFEELLGDEEIFVKIDAFESILRTLKYIKKEDFEEKLIPLIKEILENEISEYEELQYSMAALCGEFMYEMKRNGFNNSLDNLLIQLFESLIHDENEELRKKAAFNFPFFFTELFIEDNIEGSESNDEESEVHISKQTWVEYTHKLVHDNCEDVRVIMAAGFKDVGIKAIKVNQSLDFCKKIIFEFMQNDNDQIMGAMVQNLKVFIDMFQNEIGVEEWEDVDILGGDQEELKNLEKTPKSNN